MASQNDTNTTFRSFIDDLERGIDLKIDEGEGAGERVALAEELVEIQKKLSSDSPFEGEYQHYHYLSFFVESFKSNKFVAYDRGMPIFVYATNFGMESMGNLLGDYFEVRA